MAEGMFQGMSGFDVASNENAGIRDRALQMAQLGRGRVAVYAAGLEGGMMAQGLARMAGMKTPEEEKSEAVNTIMSQNANRDPNSPTDLLHISRQFVAAGLPNYAQQFRDKAREVEVKNTTMGQTDRELDQRDTRQAFDEKKLTADTSYRTSSLELQDKDLTFRTEKEETRINELAKQLELNAEELKRKLALGEFQEIVGKDGNTALYQITSDNAGNVSIKPVTIDVVQATSGGGATSSSTTNPSTSSSNVGYQSDGALITKYAATDPAEEIDADADKIYKNLQTQYEATFKDEQFIGEGTQLAVPQTGEFSNLDAVPSELDYMVYEVMKRAESYGGEIDSMYDLYMGAGSEAMEAVMKGNGLGKLWEQNKTEFEKSGDTTLYSMEGRDGLINGVLNGIVGSPIMFDVKLTENLTDENNNIIAKAGETFDSAMARVMGQDISSATTNAEGNITKLGAPESTFNLSVDAVRGIASKLMEDKAFDFLPELTGTAPKVEPNYGNQNIANQTVTAQTMNAIDNSDVVMGDTTAFDEVVKENGNIIADTVKDIKKFVINILKPKEHKDSAPENQIKSGFGSDAWSLGLLKTKVTQFDTAEKNEDGRYTLKMPQFIEVKNEKTRKAFQDWKFRNFNYFQKQGITLPNARVMPK